MPPEIAQLRERLEAAVRCDISADCSVAQLEAAHDAWARRYYPARNSGGGHGEAHNLHTAMQPAVLIYGDLPASAFGPIELQAVQLYLVQEGYCRNVVNSYIRRIRKVFRWAVSKQVVPQSHAHALQSVMHIAPERMGVTETDDVEPIDPSIVEATLAEVIDRQVIVMARLQLLTAMRPCQVCSMHSDRIDASKPECWVYWVRKRKGKHATSSKKKWHPIHLAADAIALLTSPKNGGRLNGHGRWTPSGAPLMRAGPLFTTRTGRPFTTNSYAQVLYKAARKAGLEVWSPNRLRHTAGSMMRERLGSELAQWMMGHTKLDTTEMYAQRAHKKMRKAALALTMDDVHAFRPQAARTA